MDVGVGRDAAVGMGEGTAVGVAVDVGAGVGSRVAVGLEAEVQPTTSIAVIRNNPAQCLATDIPHRPHISTPLISFDQLKMSGRP